MALTKIDDRGLKTPIDLLDNEKIRFGTGNDLEIYHSGSDSRIVESGPGSLYLGGSRVEIVNPAISELMVQCIENGSSELYYDGSKKFETLSTGWGVANTIEWHSTQGSLDLYDNKKVSFGGSRDLQIYHNGSNSYISNTHASSFYIQSNGNLLLEHTNGENYVKGNANGAVELYYDDSKKFETTSTGATVTGTLLVGTTTSSSVGGFGAGSLQLLGTSTTASASFINNENNTNVHAITLGKIRTGGANSGLVNDGDELGRIVWQGYDGSAYRMSSEIYGEVDGTPGSSDMPGRLIFSTTADGATSPTERMRIDSSGRLLLGTTTEGHADADDLTIATSSGYTGITLRSATDGGGAIYFSDATSGAGEYDGQIVYSQNSRSLVLSTAQTAALTLDSSQNATFAGTVQVGGNSAPSLLESTTGGSGSEDIFRVGLNRTNASTSDRQIWSEYTVSSSLAKFAIYARPANDTGTAGLKFSVDAVAGTVSDSKGDLRNIPRNNQTSQYTLVVGDAGKVVGVTSGGWIIPANVFTTVGQVVTLLNRSTSDQTVNASALTYLWNTADGVNVKASTLTLGPQSMATIWFEGGDTGYIQASNLTVS